VTSTFPSLSTAKLKVIVSVPFGTVMSKFLEALISTPVIYLVSEVNA